MQTIFDEIIDRRGTGSMKWDGVREDQIPLWVADMDFAAPPQVVEALRKRIEKAVFGYARPTDELNAAIVDYLKKAHDFEVDPSWLVWLPNLTPAINVICKMIAAKNGTVMTNTPMFSHILEAPRNNGIKPVEVPLAYGSSGWKMDLLAMEAMAKPTVRSFILCNPHNPVGRVYTRSELEELAAFCERHDLLVCSDEIFCDLVLEGQHVPFASLNKNTLQRTITLMSPAKTYNLAGLPCAFAIIPNNDIREQFEKACDGLIPGLGVLELSACLAAYRDSAKWRNDLLDYLRANRDFLAEFLRKNIPQLKMSKVEGTFVAWLDAKALGVENPYLFFKDSGVVLSNGKPHGGDGFLRLNFGCPRATLSDALQRMANAVLKLR
jgi:cystathionine beta-lyase